MKCARPAAVTHGLAAVLSCLLLLAPTAAHAAEPGRLVISARLTGGAARTVSASVTVGRDGRPRGTFRYVDRPGSLRVVSERLESAHIGPDEATLTGLASVNRGQPRRFQLVVRE